MSSGLSRADVLTTALEHLSRVDDIVTSVIWDGLPVEQAERLKQVQNAVNTARRHALMLRLDLF